MRAIVCACVSCGVVACAAATTTSALAAQTAIAQETSSTVAAPAKNVAAPTTASQSKFETPEAMLDALEKAGDTISTFRANVIYDRVDAVSENRERRTGEIVLAQKAGELKSRKLAICLLYTSDAADE